MDFVTRASMRRLALFALAALLAACSGETPILIGFAGPLTGKYSDLGVQGRNGARLAVEDINARGGVAGRPLKLLAEDDSMDNQGPAAADRKLMDAGVAAVVGHMTSAQTMAALDQAKKQGLVLVSPTTSTPKLSGENDVFFRVISASSEGARALARHAYTDMGLSRVAIAVDTDNAAYAEPYRKAFIETFRKLGGEGAKTVDFSSRTLGEGSDVAQRLLDANPDSVLLLASAHDAARLSRLVRNRRKHTPVLIAGWAVTREFVQLGGQAAENVTTSMGYAEDLDNPAARVFRKRFRERFGHTPSFAASYAYEAVLVLAQALKKTGGSRDGLREALQNLNGVEGILGDISLDRYGDVQRPFYILTVRNGNLKTVNMVR
jgi:branched-chain amino acid transport system substrate-binding protein